MTTNQSSNCGCINKSFYRYDANAKVSELQKKRPNRFRAQGADVLIKAKHIITMNPKQPEVEAVVIRDGYIVALGKEKELSEWVNEQTQVLDYGNNTVLPGFIEAHTHTLLLGIGLRLLNLTADVAPTRAKVLEAIAAWAKTHTERPWIIGWGYDPSLLDDSAPLSRTELDAICPDKPVLIVNNSLHLAYANSRAFALSGLDKNTPDPAGGYYTRTADGELHGEVKELSAATPLLRALPPIDFNNLCEAAYASAHMLRQQGFTTVVDAGLGLAAHHADLACYRAVAHNPDFPVRLIVCPVADIYDPSISWSEIGDKHLKLGAFKFIIDGSLQGFTANLSAPYLDKPDTSGAPTVDEQQFRAALLKAHKAGNQAFIHVNGDEAIEMALNTIDYVQQQFPRDDHRHRLEHCQLPNQAQIARMKQLGVYANFFVSHVYFWGDVHVEHTLGLERATNIDPLGWAVQQGLTFTLHSDAPVTMPNAIKLLWTATNRLTRSGKVLGEEQRITPYAALKAITIDAAFTLHEEQHLGSIEVGKLGDFTVLDQNPLTYPVEKFAQMKVVTTVLGGIDTQDMVHLK